MAYTDIDDPSAYFQTTLYTGNGQAGHAITNSGNSDLAPNWVWIKQRNGTGTHRITDSVRGVQDELIANDNIAEDTNGGGLSAFGSDGFTLGDSGAYNGNNNTYVSWNWKAGTSFSNDASATSVGTIDSAGSVSTDAGFSIISYTGTGSVGTIAHGLGVVPSMYILKRRAGGTENWPIYHQSVGNTHALYLNTTDAIYDYAGFTNDTSPTSSVFTVGGDNDQANPDGSTMIAYCFAEKQGYSKFGSYIGNNNADGPFVYTGFKPAFFMLKRTNGTEDWVIYDNKRDSINKAERILRPNANTAETASFFADILSNGFKLRMASEAKVNGSGDSYIYMAFAEQPFVTSTGVPATAR